MKHFCPICRKPTDSDTDAEFPFCSERCQQIDLGNWAAERYVVSEPVFEEDETEEGGPKASRSGGDSNPNGGLDSDSGDGAEPDGGSGPRRAAIHQAGKRQRKA